jgi:hypothetical protein
MFDMVAALTIIVTVFYVAAITHILPLPESALTRLGGFSSNVMDVLFACGSWVIRHVVDWKRIVKDGKGQAAHQRRERRIAANIAKLPELLNRPR